MLLATSVENRKGHFEITSFGAHSMYFIVHFRSRVLATSSENYHKEPFKGQMR